MVLTLIVIEALEKMSVDPRLLSRTARPAQMRDDGGRREPDRPARVAYPLLPVCFLGIHEKRLVEPAGSLENLATHEHTRADDPVHFPLGVVIPSPIVADHRMIRQERRHP